MRIFYKSYKKKKEIRRTNFERKISINSHSQNEDYPVLSLITNPNTVILSTITPCFPIATSIHHLSTKNPRSKNPVKESSTHKAFLSLSLSLSLYKFRDTTTFMHDLPNFSMRLHEKGRKEGTGGWSKHGLYREKAISRLVSFNSPPSPSRRFLRGGGWVA